VFETNENGFASMTKNYLVSGDELYETSNGTPVVPRGTIVTYESKAPTGYLISDEVSFQKILEGQDTSYHVTYNTPEVAEGVYRSDILFQKKEADGSEVVDYVAFALTSKTTGESHVLVTDANGMVNTSSDWNKHSADTNGNDWALEAEVTVDSSKLDDTAGVWFCQNTVYDEGGVVTEGEELAVDDALGALPYDTYELRELRCTGNEGLELITTTIKVSRDGVTYDYGTLTDQTSEAPAIGTHAYDAEDGDDVLAAGTVTVADEVSYTGLEPGQEYRLVAEIHDSATGEAITDADGKAITAEVTFTPTEASGSEVVEVELDTTTVGCSTVTVFETLYDADGDFVAEHADKDDTSQQVTVPEIGIATTAVDGEDGDKSVLADETVTIVDTVAYTNLTPGETYVVTGTLHLKGEDGTESTLTVDGEPVTASVEFVPEDWDGTVEVTFEFAGSALPDGTEVVVFEDLYRDDVKVASHADIDDEGQTVTVDGPRIATTATDASDGDHEVEATGSVRITDKVEYENLKAGETYVLKATLMDKETGEATGSTGEITFTAEGTSGSVDVDLSPIDTGDLAGHDLVVFEELYSEDSSGEGDAPVAEHKDIDDEGQTVTVRKPSSGGSTPSLPQTGATAAGLALAGCGIAGLGVAGASRLATRRKAAKDAIDGLDDEE